MRGDDLLCPIDMNDPMNPKTDVCADGTQFVFLPEGKPLHHGGCPPRMRWMIESIDRIEEHVLDKSKLTIILTPGAHYSALNPVFYYNRLVDLRLRLYEFKIKNPAANIIFRTPNYYPGNFEGQKAVISAFNAKRMDKIGRRVFNDSRLVRLVPTYKMSEVVFDSFGKDGRALHPGEGDGAQQWVLHGISQYTLGL